MNEYWVVYRKIEDYDGPEFEVVPGLGPRDRIIRQQTIPGEFGFKPITITHYHRHIGRDVVNLITYTHEILKPHQVRDIANKALQAARKKESEI